MKDEYISRQAAIDAINRLDIPEDMCVFEILSHIELELGTLPSAQPQYTELTPEEAASEIASGSIMSASYWLDAMIRLKQMGYAICRKR